MTRTERYLLGKYTWYLKTNRNSSNTGIDEVWRNPDATLDELLNETTEYVRKNGLYYYLTQWQECKIGRRTGVKEVELKRYTLQDDAMQDRYNKAKF